MVDALVNGGPPDTLVSQMKVEEERKKALSADLESLITMGVAPTCSPTLLHSG